MKAFHSIKIFAFIALLTSCTKERSLVNQPLPLETSAVATNTQEEHINIFKGPEVQVGNGKVRSWIKITHENQPLEMGIEFTDGALIGLPGHEHEGEAHPNWNIPLHQKAKDVTAFDHVELNWNPAGHEPLIFGTPHFDLHFYLISEAERLAIDAADPEMEILPPPNQRPAGYIPTPGGIAAMGKHWIAPPIIPPFAREMIWGSYNGTMTFIEPMVTLSYLQSGAAWSQTFGQPSVFPKPGNYPTKYNVYKNDKDNHYVTLSDFVLR